jgi:isoleucyl-tRNA synthetase
MYRKVESWFDLVALEHRVLAFWKETNAFEALRTKNRGKPHWSFLDGPITANNPMGVHHAWGRTLKDTFQRYWAMNGRELRYQNGFDCQGLWVEVEVEKELGFTSKRQIEEYGIDRFVEKCKERVRTYSAVQTEQSIRLGYWMDWSDSYFTMSDENNYTIWAFLKKCHERGKIYRGTDVMPWSGRSGTGYSQMEVVEGRRLVAHEALFLKFPLRGRQKENLLIWTTTPWTLTSNVAAMVNTDLEYARLRCRGDGEVYYLAVENLKYPRLRRQYDEGKEWIEGVPRLATIHDIFQARGGYDIEGIVRGAEMVGWEYDGPFDEMEAQGVVGGYPFTDLRIGLSGVTAHRVIDGGRDSHGNPVVVVGEGTGIVHSAPGCGDIDHVIGVAAGLPHIAPLDEEARFLDKFGPLQGQHALDAGTVAWILGSLREKGLLIHTEMYPHVYPHCWRSGDPLVFRLVDEWYIDMGWRDEIKEVVTQIRWIPAWGEERENEWLTNMRDWMISKKRFWGLALPIWVCEDCETFDVIGSKEELRARAVEGWDAFEGHSPHRPWVDAVVIACPKCGGRARRVPDVGNPWLDAGIVPYSTVRYTTDREYWKQWIPADLVLECFPGQFRNWFYSMLAMSTMMEHVRPFKTLVGHALVRDENGEEMHKSSGNAIWFDDAAEQMGADVMRWIFCRHEPTINLNFGFGVGREVRGKFTNTLWNTYSFFVNYARLDGFVPPAEPTPVASRPAFDRWITSRLQGLILDARAGYEGFDTRAVCTAVEAFVEDLSNWYVRQNRKRFWKTDDPADQRMAYETLYTCLDALVRLLAPIMPFVTEEMFQNLVRSIDPAAPVSVHLTDFPVADESLVDIVLDQDMAAIQRLGSLALKVRETAKIKVRQPLAELSIGPADEVEHRAASRFAEMIRDELNVKRVVVHDVGTPMPELPVDHMAKPNLKRLGKRLRDRLGTFKEVFPSVAAEAGRAFHGGAGTFVVTVAGEAVVIDRDDVFLSEVASRDAAMARDGDTWVSFDTVMTDDLRLEGTMREVLRGLQVLRKDVGLELEDRIHITYATSSATLETLFQRFGDTLRAELLGLTLGAGDATGGKLFAFDGDEVTVKITKA